MMNNLFEDSQDDDGTARTSSDLFMVLTVMLLSANVAQIMKSKVTDDNNATAEQILQLQGGQYCLDTECYASSEQAISNVSPNLTLTISATHHSATDVMRLIEQAKAQGVSRIFLQSGKGE